MKLHELKGILQSHPNKQPRFVLPDGESIPAHYHITEVGHVTKHFVDCGGTVRNSASCVLQVWIGSDEQHRLSAAKLQSILNLGSRVLPGDDLDVELEYEDCAISQFPILKSEGTGEFLDFHLGVKHTDCLAKEACGLEPASKGAKGGCC